MSGAVITPWRDDDEWKEVRALLYSSSVEERQQGSQRVQTLWSSRSGPRLPIAVVSTALLVPIVDGLHSMDPLVGRHAMAMIIVRCVDGLAEASRIPGRARDIRDLLSHIQDEAVTSLIDIRHACVHGVLPSLDALTCAARDCLRILYNSYWSLSGDSMMSAGAMGESVTTTMSSSRPWDGTALSLLSEWSSWSLQRIHAALLSVPADRWRASALARVRVVWGVKALIFLVPKAAPGVLKWLVFHSASRRVWNAVYRRAVTEALSLEPSTWQTLHRHLAIDSVVTKWLLRHRVAPPSQHSLIGDDNEADSVKRAVPRFAHIPSWTTRKSQLEAQQQRQEKNLDNGRGHGEEGNDARPISRVSDAWVDYMQAQMIALRDLQ